MTFSIQRKEVYILTQDGKTLELTKEEMQAKIQEAKGLIEGHRKEIAVLQGFVDKASSWVLAPQVLSSPKKAPHTPGGTSTYEHNLYVNLSPLKMARVKTVMSVLSDTEWMFVSQICDACLPLGLQFNGGHIYAVLPYMVKKGMVREMRRGGIRCFMKASQIRITPKPTLDAVAVDTGGLHEALDSIKKSFDQTRDMQRKS